MPLRLMRTGRPRSRAGARPISERRGKTWPNWSIDGSFVEYGSLAIAAQRRRRKLDDLIKNTPADGLITGIATVNADKFGADDARCMVIAYDYTVLAGTQGHMNHKKIDRMLGLAEQWRCRWSSSAKAAAAAPATPTGSA